MQQKLTAIPEFLREHRKTYVPEMTQTKSGPIQTSVLDRLKHKVMSKEKNILENGVKEITDLLSALIDMQKNQADECYLFDNYFAYKDKPDETTAEQKLRVFGYMLDFVKTQNSEALLKSIRPEDADLFRTYVFCEITDFVKFDGKTYVKFKNSHKMESAMLVDNFNIAKGPCMITHEKDIGITSYVSLPHLRDAEFLSKATWAIFKKVVK